MDDNLMQTESSRRGKFHRSKRQRLPRIFKEVCRVLEEVRTQHRSLKSAVYSTKFKGHVIQKIYGLAFNITKNLPIINSILKESGLPTREPSISLEIAQILVHEIIKNHPLPGQSKPVLILEKYRNDILKVHSEFMDQKCIMNTTCPYVPRYARVQTTVTTVEDVLQALKHEGYVQKNYDVGLPLSSYHEEVKSLKSGEFLQDIHFKDVLVFPKGENLVFSHLYKNGHLFLQDKASYIPVYALDPKPESIVLDCCAAPGMKTAHLACLMKNTGQIYAVDRDKERFLSLQNTLNQGHVKNCTASCIDFTSINPNEKPYSLVEYILIDPSCSGSGMLERMNCFGDDDYSKDQFRIEKLSRFQITLLKHALSFPSVKRIVYSTCSIYEEENEYVINEALKGFSGVFDVTPVFPVWPSRGSTNYSFGKSCIRSSPEDNLTSGFFVAMISRVNGFNDLKGSVEQQISIDEKLVSQDKFYATEDKEHEKSNEQKIHALESSPGEKDVTFSRSFTNKDIDEKQLPSSRKHKKCKKEKRDKERAFLEYHADETYASENEPDANVAIASPTTDSGNSNQMQVLNSCERRKCKKKDKERGFVENYEEANALENVSAATNVKISEDESGNQMQLHIRCERRKCKKKKKDKERLFVENNAREMCTLNSDSCEEVNTDIPILDAENKQTQIPSSSDRRKCKKKRRDKERELALSSFKRRNCKKRKRNKEKIFVAGCEEKIRSLESDVISVKSDSDKKVEGAVKMLEDPSNSQTEMLKSHERRKCKKKKKDKERSHVGSHEAKVSMLENEIFCEENNPDKNIETTTQVPKDGSSLQIQLPNYDESKMSKKRKNDSGSEFIEKQPGEIYSLESDSVETLSTPKRICESDGGEQVQLLSKRRSKNCKKRKKKEKDIC